MTDAEDFQLMIYHAKLEWGSICAGYKGILWDAATQNQINALAGFTAINYDIEAHLIASQRYTNKKISIEDLIGIIATCCKQLQGNNNRHACRSNSDE